MKASAKRPSIQRLKTTNTRPSLGQPQALVHGEAANPVLGLELVLPVQPHKVDPLDLFKASHAVLSRKNTPAVQ